MAAPLSSSCSWDGESGSGMTRSFSGLQCPASLSTRLPQEAPQSVFSQSEQPSERARPLQGWTPLARRRRRRRQRGRRLPGSRRVPAATVTGHPQVSLCTTLIRESPPRRAQACAFNARVTRTQVLHSKLCIEHPFSLVQRQCRWFPENTLRTPTRLLRSSAVMQLRSGTMDRSRRRRRRRRRGGPPASGCSSRQPPPSAAPASVGGPPLQQPRGLAPGTKTLKLFLLVAWYDKPQGKLVACYKESRKKESYS